MKLGNLGTTWAALFSFFHLDTCPFSFFLSFFLFSIAQAFFAMKLF
jgi:hypothetical protein